MPLQMRRPYVFGAQTTSGHFPVRPWLSLVLTDTPVNKETEAFLNVMEIGVMYPVFHQRHEGASNLRCARRSFRSQALELRNSGVAQPHNCLISVRIVRSDV